MKDSGKAVKGLMKRFFHIPGDTVNLIAPGNASIVETAEGKVGVYRAEDGQLFQVDIVCPPSGLPACMESGRADVGLSLSRIPVQLRRKSAGRSGSGWDPP